MSRERSVANSSLIVNPAALPIVRLTTRVCDGLDSHSFAIRDFEEADVRMVDLCHTHLMGS